MRDGLQEGQVIAGRYRLQRITGRGGMSLVWRAVDENSGNFVAVKEQHLDKKAQRAAAVLATIDHPYVARVLAWDPEWLVMEYIDGGTLADRLEDGHRISQAEAARVGAQIASALETVHVKGLVHCDVKPGNIMFADDRTAKLTDFGISHVAWGDPTGAGLVGGTPAYVAPEVADGGPRTPASDVFSLGATIFAAVEGAPVYGYGTTSNTYKMLALARDREISKPRRAGALTSALDEMLRADPAQRPTAARAYEMLARACPEVVVEPPGPRAPVRIGRLTMPRWPSGRAARAAIAGVAVAVLVLLGLALVPDGAASAHHPPLTIGDPRTADPCSLTRATAFTRYGDATLSTDYGNFNRCDVLVQSGGGSDVDVEVQLEVPGWFDDPSLNQRPKPGHIRTVTKPDDGSACDRALVLPDGGLILIAAKQDGTSGKAPLCEMADTQDKVSIAALRRTGVRHWAPPGHASLASRDACSLPDAKTLDSVHGIAGGTRTQGFADWECQWDSNSAGSYVMLLFDRGVPLDSSYGKPIRPRGHPLPHGPIYIQKDGDGENTCVAEFAYRQYEDPTGQVTQDMVRLTVGDVGSVSRSCDDVTRVAEDVAAHLAH
ncbi:MAG: serine/threonine protein kinase [Nocardiopsaceae bacterium]|nr:serine/threonine protein kinase [Nocardiopsaceae bacterium]